MDHLSICNRTFVWLKSACVSLYLSIWLTLCLRSVTSELIFYLKLSAYLSVCLFSTVGLFVYPVIEWIRNLNCRRFSQFNCKGFATTLNLSFIQCLTATNKDQNWRLNKKNNNNNKTQQLTHQCHNDLQWSPQCSYKRSDWHHQHKIHYCDMYG